MASSNSSNSSNYSDFEENEIDILAPCRKKKNKYIQDNMFADLPPESMPNQYKLGRYLTNSNYHTFNDFMHENGKGHVFPARIDFPLEILLLEGKDNSQRTRESQLKTSTDKDSIKGALLLILTQEKLNKGLDSFILCYRKKPDKKKGEKKPRNPKSIYDYVLTKVELKNTYCFCLREVRTESSNDNGNNTNNKDSYSKQGNKNKLLQKHQAIQKAEALLRDRLGIEAYKKLQSKPKIHVQARWELGPGNKSWNQVRNLIFDAISDKEEEKSNVPNTTNTTHQEPQTLNTLNNINNTLQQLNSNMTTMASMMLNLQQRSYSATHSSTTSVSQSRYNPTASIADPTLPVCVASLPNSILPNLPDLNKNSK